MKRLRKLVIKPTRVLKNGAEIQIRLETNSEQSQHLTAFVPTEGEWEVMLHEGRGGASLLYKEHADGLYGEEQTRNRSVMSTILGWMGRK